MFWICNFQFISYCFITLLVVSAVKSKVYVFVLIINCIHHNMSKVDFSSKLQCMFELYSIIFIMVINCIHLNQMTTSNELFFASVSASVLLPACFCFTACFCFCLVVLCFFPLNYFFWSWIDDMIEFVCNDFWFMLEIFNIIMNKSLKNQCNYQTQ